jgi:hypothetical protein
MYKVIILTVVVKRSADAVLAVLPHTSPRRLY